jgi:hypothetical protein
LGLEDIEGEEGDPFSDQFDKVGYGSKLIYGNLGSIFILQIAMLIGQIINYFVLKVSQWIYLPPYFRIVKNFLQRRLDNYAWNGQIQFSAQNYLIRLVTAFICIQNLRFSGMYTPVEQFSSVAAIALFVNAVLFPFVVK